MLSRRGYGVCRGNIKSYIENLPQGIPRMAYTSRYLVPSVRGILKPLAENLRGPDSMSSMKLGLMALSGIGKLPKFYISE